MSSAPGKDGWLDCVNYVLVMDSADEKYRLTVTVAGPEKYVLDGKPKDGRGLLNQALEVLSTVWPTSDFQIRGNRVSGGMGQITDIQQKPKGKCAPPATAPAPSIAATPPTEAAAVVTVVGAFIVSTEDVDTPPGEPPAQGEE